jgi:hypothetical protein
MDHPYLYHSQKHHIARFKVCVSYTHKILCKLPLEHRGGSNLPVSLTFGSQRLSQVSALP